jgi:hypothetical protein
LREFQVQSMTHFGIVKLTASSLCCWGKIQKLVPSNSQKIAKFSLRLNCSSWAVYHCHFSASVFLLHVSRTLLTYMRGSPLTNTCVQATNKETHMIQKHSGLCPSCLRGYFSLYTFLHV